MFKKSIFIFRRDLRLSDNLGLIEALKNSEKVLPIFIFTPEQIGTKNKFSSDNALQYMKESLEDLNSELSKKGSKLFMLNGAPEKVLSKLIKSEKAEAVYVNRDYTPYSVKRDKKLERTCKKAKVEFISLEDALLNPIDLIVKKADEPYKVFTPYYNKAKEAPIPKPKNNRHSNYYSKSSRISNQVPKTFLNKLCEDNPDIRVNGGRKKSLSRIKILKV